MCWILAIFFAWQVNAFDPSDVPFAFHSSQIGGSSGTYFGGFGWPAMSMHSKFGKVNQDNGSVPPSEAFFVTSVLSSLVCSLKPGLFFPIPAKKKATRPSSPQMRKLIQDCAMIARMMAVMTTVNEMPSGSCCRLDVLAYSIMMLMDNGQQE
jgi:hypothetical protein